MARPKRARRCYDKRAKDGANGGTAVVPDEIMVDDEAANNDDLADAVSTRTRRARVSTGGVPGRSVVPRPRR